jgi:DNA-binding winged helix-turn-helix (wHTH) protein
MGTMDRRASTTTKTATAAPRRPGTPPNPKGGGRSTEVEGGVRRSGVLLFGEYSFDLGRRELSHRSAVVHLEPRVAELLALLIQGAGQLIPRDALRSMLWPDGDGSDSALNYLVSSARQALSGSLGRPIAMIRGRGYRFEAPVAHVTPTPEARPLYGRSAELQELRRLGEMGGSVLAGSKYPETSVARTRHVSISSIYRRPRCEVLSA